MTDHHSLEARERYFKRYTTVVSVSARSGVGSPFSGRSSNTTNTDMHSEMKNGSHVIWYAQEGTKLR